MIYTIGHSTRGVDELIALLRESRVDLLVDIRSVPRSRFNPQFNTEALPEPLREAGIAYHHIKALGGLRHRPKDAPPSPNTAWRNDAFRNYSDYALTAAFREGSPNCAASPLSIAARLCAPRRCGGAVTAALSPTICSPKRSRCGTSWDLARSSRRGSPPAPWCGRTARSFIPPRRGSSYSKYKLLKTVIDSSRYVVTFYFTAPI